MANIVFNVDRLALKSATALEQLSRRSKMEQNYGEAMEKRKVKAIKPVFVLCCSIYLNK